MKKSKELGDGLFVASFVVFSLIIFVLIWAPFGYYLGKWSDFWRRYPVTTFKENDQSAEKYNKAATECENKALDHFKGSKVLSYAFTSNDYDTYECYGLKFEKIK